MERRYARRALTTVQGIVVRGGIVDRGTDTEEYIVVWSKKAGHSIAMMEKLSPNMRLNVNPLDWIQYDVEFMEQPGVEIPEGIRSRAVNLRLPSPGMSENPCDIADLFDKQRIIQNFSLSEDYTTIRFRDHYRLSQRLGALGVEVYAKSEFIEKAKLSSGDLCKLQEHGIREFDAVAVLEKVVDCHNDCPWIIEIFVVDGKEHAVSGLLSKKGMRMRGPGGVVLPRGQARVPPDVLRPNSNTKQPSRFSSVYSESKFVNLRQEQTDYYEAGMAAGLIQDGSDMLHQIPCPKLVKEEASIRDDSVSVMQHQNPNPKMVKDVSLIQSGSDTQHPMMARDVLRATEAIPVPESVILQGIVVYAYYRENEDPKCWLLYDSTSSAQPRFYKMDPAINVMLGKWYRLKVADTADLTGIISHTDVCVKEWEGPVGVQTRLIPSRQNPSLDGYILLTLVVRVREGVLYHPEIRCISDPLEKIHPSEDMDITLEVSPCKEGWQVECCHGRIALEKVVSFVPPIFETCEEFFEALWMEGQIGQQNREQDTSAEGATAAPEEMKEVHPEAAEMIAIIRRLRGTKRLSVLLDADAKLAELVKKIDEYLE